MLRLITEITLLGILAWTITEVSYIPKEFITEWKAIKKPKERQLQGQRV